MVSTPSTSMNGTVTSIGHYDDRQAAKVPAETTGDCAQADPARVWLGGLGQDGHRDDRRGRRHVAK